jgi:hypothetical protein
MFRQTFVAVAVVAAGSATAFAGDPKFEFGKSEEVEKVKDVEWTAAGEIGAVFTTGNSETTTISGGLRASRKTGKNKLSVEAALTYARSAIRVLADKNGNGEIDSEAEIISVSSTTAETLASKVRYDRFLTKFNSVFVAALAARDVPAGKESVIGGQIGYSRQLRKTKTSETVGEFGYDYSREDLVVGDPVSIHSARAFMGHKAVMTEGTTLEASLEMLTNLVEVTLPTGKDGSFGKDTRLDAKVAISAKIGKNLAAQMQMQVKYDNRPAPLAIKPLAMGFVPESSKLDTIMKASLIYTFF